MHSLHEIHILLFTVYICLCNVDTEHYNRLFLAEDKRHYHIKATRELIRSSLVGMIQQFIPITHRRIPGQFELWNSQVPTLQFLAAVYISEEESRNLQHLPTEPDECLQKKCYQIEVWYDLLLDPWIGQTCVCNGASM